MPSASPQLFPDLFGRQPDLVRHFLHAALQLRDLQELYSVARSQCTHGLARAVLEVLNVDLRVNEKDLLRIPAKGPVVVVANHPFGLLDGMLLDSLLGRVRPDIKILTNSMISRLPELQERCLPIDVFGNSKGNVASLRHVVSLLRAGGGAAFFPAGEVSHWQAGKRRVADPEWSSVPARCALLTDAQVVPVFFLGKNSLGYQIAGLIHPRLRTARLPGELLNKRGQAVEVRIGNPIRSTELGRFGSAESATVYLRARTYTLGQRGKVSSGSKPLYLPLLGKVTKSVEPIAAPADQEQLCREIKLLTEDGASIIETSEYRALALYGELMPAVLREIGRLRETTFRQAGEGSGKALDLDPFDKHYSHLILWHKERQCIAGGYRLAWTENVLPERGAAGLYTSTLFRFHPAFFRHLGPAVELGRSFVRPEFQKDYAPLLLLWQAIARYVARRPEAPILFGPVSISAGYPQAARELIVRFVSENSFRADLAGMIKPRHPFRSRLIGSHDLQVVGSCLRDMEDLAGPLRDLGAGADVPVLLRQYLKLGGRVAGFNVDTNFGNVLDGLLIVDLRETAPKMLNRYMGAELAEQYRRSVTPPRTA